MNPLDSIGRRMVAVARAITIAFPLTLLATGCGYVEMHEAVLRPTTGPSARAVEMYVGEQSPNRPYYEVALLQAFGYGGDANIEDLTAALEGRGRALGCDGLLRVRFDMGYSMAHAYGVCVKWSQAVQGTVQTNLAAPAPVPAAPSPSPSPSPPAPATPAPGERAL